MQLLPQQDAEYRSTHALLKAEKQWAQMQANKLK